MTLLFWTCPKFWTVHIFELNIFIVRYMLYNHCTVNCIFLYFLEAKNPCFVAKNCNFHKSGTVGRRKLPDPLMNRIFNALSMVYNIRSYFNELILA